MSGDPGKLLKRAGRPGKAPTARSTDFWGPLGLLATYNKNAQSKENIDEVNVLLSKVPEQTLPQNTVSNTKS